MRPKRMTLGAAAIAMFALSITSDGLAQTGTKSVNNEGVAAYKAKDFVTARQKFNQSCTAENDPKGCYHLGMMYEEALGGERNDTGAREAYKKSCDKDYALACAFLGLMYYQGKGGAKDEAAARNLLEKACDLKHAKACFNLGELYERGWNGVKDHLSAQTAFRWACILKYQPACFRGTVAAPAPITQPALPAPKISESGEEWCLNGHRHFVKTDGKLSYTSACHSQH